MPDVRADAWRQPLEVRRHAIHYPTAQAAFDAGDYLYAATQAGDDRRLKGCALIMMGHYEGGLPLLEGFEEPAACYYRAVALWGYGENQEALSWIQRGLEGATPDLVLPRRLEQLRGLIVGGPIRVLVQARNAAAPSSFGIVSAMKRVGGFEVCSVGYQDSDDRRIEPYVELKDVLASLPSGWAPHFFHCYQVESNLMPSGMEQAPFSVIGYVSDYDTRVHTCYYRARVCDAMMVAGGIDHYEVSRGFGLPAYVFPKAVGVCASAFKSLDVSQKSLDLFCSGTAMTFYQNDKGTLLYRLTQLPESYRIRIVQGFLESTRYFQQVAQAKAVFSFVRRQPVWSSRALEALAGGAVALYQAGGGLELFFSEAEGAVPYTEENLDQVAVHVVDHWDTLYGPAALRGRERVLKEFDLDVCMARYLKHMAILSRQLAERPRPGNPLPIEAALRYPPTAHGSFVASRSSKRRVWCQAFARTAARLSGAATHGRSPNADNILAFACLMMGHRDSAIDKLEWKLVPHSNTYVYFAKAIEALEGALRRYPNDLLLRFNLGRLCYHTGRQERAYAAFGEVVSATSVHFNPLMDLYGEDFGEINLAFRDYVDDLWRYLVTKDTGWLQRLADILVASAWQYRSLIEQKQGDVRRALRSAECAIRRHAHSAWYHEHYANLLRAVSKRAATAQTLAVRHMEMAWSISPYGSAILAKYAAWVHRSGDVGRAGELLHRYDRLSGRTEGLIAMEKEARLLAPLRAACEDVALAGQGR